MACWALNVGNQRVYVSNVFILFLFIFFEINFRYVFDPAFKTVTVAAGGTAVVAFTATRTAYSVMGTVLSLNGEPEKGVIVEGVFDVFDVF